MFPLVFWEKLILICWDHRTTMAYTCSLCYKLCIFMYFHRCKWAQGCCRLSIWHISKISFVLKLKVVKKNKNPKKTPSFYGMKTHLQCIVVKIQFSYDLRKNIHNHKHNDSLFRICSCSLRCIRTLCIHLSASLTHEYVFVNNSNNSVPI